MGCVKSRLNSAFHVGVERNVRSGVTSYETAENFDSVLEIVNRNKYDKELLNNTVNVTFCCPLCDDFDCRGGTPTIVSFAHTRLRRMREDAGIKRQSR